MYWHSYECSEKKCPRGPTGIIVDVRTDDEKAPSKVTCPLCKKSARYRGSHPANDAGFGGNSNAQVQNGVIEKALRTKAPKEIYTILESARITDDWMYDAEGQKSYLFRVGNPFRSIARVEKKGTVWQSFYESSTGLESLGAFNTRRDAQGRIETYLSLEEGYIIGTSALVDVPERDVE